MSVGLLDIRDELTEAKNFVACLVLACSSQRYPAPERAALCAVGDAARGKLEAIDVALDHLLRGAQPGQSPDAA